MRDVLVRVLALAVAVAMVVGALALRDRFDDGGEPEARPTVDGPGPGTDDLHVICLEEVTFACESLAGLGVASGTSIVRGPDAAAAALDERPGAVLVALAEVPALLDDRSERRGGERRLTEVRDLGWSSPVVAAVWQDRRAVLDARCDGGLSWPCLGDVAGATWTSLGGDERWGAVTPAHADPQRSTIGLLSLAQGVAAQVGDVGFSLGDLQTDATRAWLIRLERAVPTGQTRDDQIEQMVRQGRSAMDVGLTLEAMAARTLPVAGTRGDGLELVYLDPWIEARVVVAGGDAAVVAAVADALGVSGGDAEEAGWRIDDAPPVALPSAPSRPADVVMPRAGALEALLSLQAEVVR